MRLVLASASPRRKQLLLRIGVTPDEIRPSRISEARQDRELPRIYCRRIAREKALATECRAGDLVIAADTIVALGRRILGKPQDRDDAAAMLTRLSGRRHRVITAVALRHESSFWLRDVVSVVRLKRLSEQEIQQYVESGEWQGKAGGYGLQGRAAAFVPWIRGSHSAIVGLPLAETASLLKAANYPIDRQ